MGLRSNHVPGDTRQEHVDNHNLIEPVVADILGAGSDFAEAVVASIPNGTYADAEATAEALDSTAIAYVPPPTGVAATDAANILAAIDFLPVAGGIVQLAAGTYVTSTAFGIVDQDDVEIRGRGMGRTEVDASSVDTLTIPTTTQRGVYGVFYVDSAGTATKRRGFTLSDMTIRYYQGPVANTQKGVFLGWCDDVTIQRVRFFGSNNGNLTENVYHDTNNQGQAVRNIKVLDCIFEGGSGEQVTFNKLDTFDVEVRGNYFRDCEWIGVHIIASSYLVTGNVFTKPRYNAIRMGEGTSITNGVNSGACIVANNVIDGWGTGCSNSDNISAIQYNGRAALTATAGVTTERGVLISNNTIRNCTPNTTNIAVAIRVLGSAVVSGNLIAGLDVVNPNTYGVLVAPPSDLDTAASTTAVVVHLIDNIVEKTNNAAKWGFGIATQAHANADRMTVLCSGNYVDDVDASTGIGFSVANAATFANVYFDGDVIVGPLIMRKGTIPNGTNLGRQRIHGSNVATRIVVVDGIQFGPTGTLMTATAAGLASSVVIVTPGIAGDTLNFYGADGVTSHLLLTASNLTLRRQPGAPSTFFVDSPTGQTSGFQLLVNGVLAVTFQTDGSTKGHVQSWAGAIAGGGAGGIWFNESVCINNATLATSATDGFLYIPNCAGTPTGVPRTQPGVTPIVYDITNDRLMVYRGGWKTLQAA